MLILIAVLIALVPAVIVLYPILRRIGIDEFEEDESSISAELQRRWHTAVAALKTAELEGSIGNLSEEDHRWLMEHYTAEAALVMKAMDLEEQQEEELLSRMRAEVEAARISALGPATGQARDAT